jgi:hypothetical protein
MSEDVAAQTGLTGQEYLELCSQLLAEAREGYPGIPGIPPTTFGLPLALREGATTENPEQLAEPRGFPDNACATHVVNQFRTCLLVAKLRPSPTRTDPQAVALLPGKITEVVLPL